MEKYENNPATRISGDKPKRTPLIVAALVVVVIVLIGLFGYLHRPVSGTVTSFTITSITIRPSGSSATKTYAITNTTVVGLPKSSPDYGVPEPYNVKYFHDGEAVEINVGSDNQARAITVNS